MTLYDRRALLMEFTKWCADHGYLDSSFGGVDAFLASLPEPIPACPVCGAVRGDWECRHGAKDEPVPLNLGRRDGEDVPPAPERNTTVTASVDVSEKVTSPWRASRSWPRPAAASASVTSQT